jgi:hypothetical protein
MKKFEPFATIAFAFQLPITLPRGTEVSIRGATRGCEYARKLKLKATTAGQCLAELTDPAGDTYRLLLDLKRNQVGLIDSIPTSTEDAQEFIARQMLVVGELCDRLRPKSEPFSNEDRLERDRPLFELIESTSRRWATEHAVRCGRLGNPRRGQDERLH